MKIQVFVVTVLLVLSACTVSAETAHDPAALPVAATPTALPSETPASLPSVLAVFPLSTGAAWKYTAEIEYQDPDNLQETLTWTGMIIVSVVDQENTPDGKIVFTLKEDLDPTPPQDVWRQSCSFEYIADGGEIYEGSEKIVQWPLTDKMSWITWPDFEYQTEVSFTGNIETPYGNLEDCYQISILTGPDIQIKVFCPGEGFVHHYYHHFGTPQNERFDLVSFEPGN